MNFTELFEQLRALGSEQTRKTYRRHGLGDNTFGVSYAHLGQLKKQLVGRGKDKARAHALARQLWACGNQDARTLATMVADAQQLTPAEARDWAATLANYAQADALAGLLAETPFARTQMEEWLVAADELPQRLGYALLSRLALQAPGPDDEYFEKHVARIEEQIQRAPNRAREGMNSALLAIGSRSEALRQRVEQAADLIGPVVIDHGDTACQTPAIRPYLAKVWGRRVTQV